MDKDALRVIKYAAWVLKIFPKIIQNRAARWTLGQLRMLMPTSGFNITIADPVTAMVVTALQFLMTPAGQQICADIRAGGKTLIDDLLNHVHEAIPPKK